MSFTAIYVPNIFPVIKIVSSSVFDVIDTRVLVTGEPITFHGYTKTVKDSLWSVIAGLMVSRGFLVLDPPSSLTRLPEAVAGWFGQLSIYHPSKYIAAPVT